MDTVYFDWSGGFLTCIRNDDPAPEGIWRPPTTKTLLDSLTEPTILVSEATFESFDLAERIRVIEQARLAGHIWLTTPNRQTGRHRRGMGHPDEDKTDDLDVTVIRDIAQTRPETLKRPTPPVNVMEFRAQRAANDELMVLRRTKRVVPNRSALGFKTISAKDDYADTLIELLPDINTLTEAQKVSLGSKAGKKFSYSKCLVAAVAKAVKYSGSRREFEQLSGLFGHGYPSQIRSDIHHWRWRFASKHGITLSQFRREIRWLYHRLTELREHL